MERPMGGSSCMGEVYVWGMGYFSTGELMYVEWGIFLQEGYLYGYIFVREGYLYG